MKLIAEDIGRPCDNAEAAGGTGGAGRGGVSIKSEVGESGELEVPGVEGDWRNSIGPSGLTTRKTMRTAEYQLY